MSKVRCMGCMEIYDDEYEMCPKCFYVRGSLQKEFRFLKTGTILKNRYVVGKVIGSGGFGITYIGWDNLLAFKVAIKEYYPIDLCTRKTNDKTILSLSGFREKNYKNGLDKFVEEARKLANFNDLSGVVEIYDCLEENNTSYIIMEYLEGETLSCKLDKESRMTANETIGMLMPIMQSLKEIHDCGVIHRDIAPDNIFITKDGKVKLLDFGSARYSSSDEMDINAAVVIKDGYSPIEQYRSIKEQGKWTDVYALAVTMYRMITGDEIDNAFVRLNSKKMIRYEHVLLKKSDKYITEAQRNAIERAMEVNVEKRTKDMKEFMCELNENNKKRCYLIKKSALIGSVAVAIIILFFGMNIYNDYTKKINTSGDAVQQLKASLEPEELEKVPELVVNATFEEPASVGEWMAIKNKGCEKEKYTRVINVSKDKDEIQKFISDYNRKCKKYTEDDKTKEIRELQQDKSFNGKYNEQYILLEYQSYYPDDFEKVDMTSSAFFFANADEFSGIVDKNKKTKIVLEKDYGFEYYIFESIFVNDFNVDSSCVNGDVINFKVLFIVPYVDYKDYYIRLSSDNTETTEDAMKYIKIE